MESWEDIVIIIGMSSVLALWGFAALGAVGSLWDTFGSHIADLAERIRRRRVVPRKVYNGERILWGLEI